MPTQIPNDRFGWAGEDAAAKAWELLGDQFPSFKIFGAVSAAGRTFRAWDIFRRVLGHDMLTYPQQTGDCVAVSTKEAIQGTAIIEIANGDREIYKEIFAPFLYAIARCLVGKNQLRGQDGVVASWMAKATEVYGTLPTDTPGLPAYSKVIADAWGNDSGEWRKYLQRPDLNTIQTSARLRQWSELVDAVNHGHLCTMASNMGFEMSARSDGFHHRSGTWPHQMSIWGISDDSRKPWVGVKNQWDDVFGQIIDFETGQPWPRGMLRVRPDDIQEAFNTGEIFAYSNYDGFPDNSDKWDDWSLVPNNSEFEIL